MPDNNRTRALTHLKLGKRLKQIAAMVIEPYDHIWDCCCDHGLLGAALLSRQAAPQIHFVDVMLELTRLVEAKLHRFHPKTKLSNSPWQVHCMDAADLPLSKLNGTHLVIIAGVGGDLMTGLVKAIYENNRNIPLDFLLCPVHHQYTLRQQLIQLDFSLKNEVLIAENQRFYEILLVSTIRNVDAKINPVGDLIWQSTSTEQAKIAAAYLQKTLDHYRRMQLSGTNEIQYIVDAYSAVLARPCTT